MNLFSSIDKESGGGVTDPNHGQIIGFNETGLTYKPNDGWCGYDSFTYTITKGDLSSSATVTVHILCASPIVEDPPHIECSVIATDDIAIVNPDTFVVISPLDNDHCGELIIESTTGSTHGVIEITGGTFIKYTPNANSCEDSSSDSITDQIIYKAKNQAGSEDFASIYIDICCSCGLSSTHIALNDEATTESNVPVTVSPLDNDSFEAVITSVVVIDGSHGTCVINDGQTITYTPGKSQKPLMIRLQNYV